ncbi:MAG TPA: ABC transporter permease, partial [Saprospiraceae bacterium]|nr:ABC transporter permease [Saprospiraceae bacterium]
IGGVMGIVMVFVSLKVISNFIPFAMGLDFTNVLVGVIISVIVGILAGVIPAYRASNLSPVEAIRG